MVKHAEKVLREYGLGNVPTVDVMGFKVVAGGELSARLKFATFAADQYWKGVTAKLERDKFNWAKYMDEWTNYWKAQQAWLQKYLGEKEYQSRMAGANASAYAAFMSAQAQIESARIRANAAMSAAAMHERAAEAAAAKSMSAVAAQMSDRSIDALATSMKQVKENQSALKQEVYDFLTGGDSTSKYIGGSGSSDSYGWVRDETSGQTWTLDQAWGGGKEQEKSIPSGSPTLSDFKATTPAERAWEGGGNG